MATEGHQKGRMKEKRRTLAKGSSFVSSVEEKMEEGKAKISSLKRKGKNNVCGFKIM